MFAIIHLAGLLTAEELWHVEPLHSQLKAVMTPESTKWVHLLTTYAVVAVSENQDQWDLQDLMAQTDVMDLQEKMVCQAKMLSL